MKGKTQLTKERSATTHLDLGFNANRKQPRNLVIGVNTSMPSEVDKDHFKHGSGIRKRQYVEKMNEMSVLSWFQNKDVGIAKLKVKLLHENCKSRFESVALRDVKMMLGTSTPLKSSLYHYTTEAIYPVNSKKKVPMVLRELRNNTSFHSLESWSLQGNILKVSFIEKNEDSPMALIQPLGILQYKEVSHRGTDNISVTLHEVNVKPLLDVLNTLGDATIVRKYKVGDKMLNFNYILTEREEEVLERAIFMGYFEYPKKCYLKDIAKVTGISIVAVDKLLRSAERKIIIGNYIQ